MSTLINSSSAIYAVFSGWTTDVTGSVALTLFFFILFMAVLALIFRLPIELTVIVVLPVGITLAAFYTTDFLGIAGVMLLYLGVLLGKYFFFK